MKQYIITPAMGKRMIGTALTKYPVINEVLTEGTMVIIAGTTNGYVAEEILKSIGQAERFDRNGFRRGVVTPIGFEPPDAEFPGDVVIKKGQWIRGKTIFDVVDDLESGDLVLKGGNCFDQRGQAAVHIGGSKGGTILAALTAIIGRRVGLIVPVGLEKRVYEDVNLIAQRCIAPGAEGPRLMPMPGEVFTEIEAIHLWSGAQATLISAGGVYGAEGSVRLGINGTAEQMADAQGFIINCSAESPCEV